jgi:peptidyl-prolyl cis-trans isomerase D
MLSALRNLAKTWVAKALFVLLILSFAVWGIEDTVRNFGRDNAVARVGGEPIELDAAQNAVQRELQQIQRRLGPNFEPDANIRRAIAAQALEQLVAERTLEQEARRMGVAAPEAAIRDYVFSIPSFQLGGQFSRAMLDNFLRQSQMNEAQFLALVASDLRRIQLVGAVRAGAPGPDALARALIAWDNEQRAAEVAQFPLLEAPEPEPPTEAQLSRFHENNPQQFSAPERREAVLAVLSAATLADQVEVTEQDLAAGYEQRHEQYTTPERRTLEQALLPSREAAEQIVAQWRGGADFAAIQAAAQAAGGAALSLGELVRAGMPVPELADAAFAGEVGTVTDPVQSPFGWHVMRVAAITPGGTVPLAEVTEALRHEIAMEKAADLAFSRASRVEDALAGGTSLEEAARENGMALAHVTLDATGRGAEGMPVQLPVPEPAREEAVRAIFAAEQGQAPRLQETRDGSAFLAVELRQVMPAALRPLAEVEGEVRQAFLTDARRRHQEQRAAALLAAIRGGKSIAEAAAEQGAQVESFGPFGRQPQEGAAPGTAIPPELLAPLFEAKPGEATMVPTRTGFAVAQLSRIIPADPGADAEALARRRTEVQQAMAQDLEAQFAMALRSQAQVTVNQPLLEQISR